MVVRFEPTESWTWEPKPFRKDLGLETGLIILREKLSGYQTLDL